MKRDMDLIREILIKIEEMSEMKFDTVHIEEFDENCIAYHLQLLQDAGLIMEVWGTSSPHPSSTDKSIWKVTE